MNKIIEPLSETVLHVHHGVKGLKTFKSYLDRNKIQYSDLTSNAGFQINNHIWIHDIKDLHTLLHEVVHFLDYVNERLNIHEEREFKAYLGSYILNKVLKLALRS